MVGFLVVLVFSFVWYFPLYKRAKNRKIKTKRLVLALFLGMIPALVLSSLCQLLVGMLCNAVGITGAAKQVMLAVFGAGICEEILKFCAGKIACGKASDLGAIDYILAFGTVGLGFEALETLLGAGNAAAGILRGIFLLHVIFQFYMGERCFRYQSTRDKKYLVKAFAVPMTVHAVFDSAVFVLAAAVDTESGGLNEALLLAGIILWIVTLIMVIALMIKTVKLNRNALSEGQQRGLQPEAHNEGRI